MSQHVAEFDENVAAGDWPVDGLITPGPPCSMARGLGSQDGGWFWIDCSGFLPQPHFLWPCNMLWPAFSFKVPFVTYNPWKSTNYINEHLQHLVRSFMYDDFSHYSPYFSPPKIDVGWLWKYDGFIFSGVSWSIRPLNKSMWPAKANSSCPFSRSAEERRSAHLRGQGKRKRGDNRLVNVGDFAWLRFVLNYSWNYKSRL